MTNGEPRPVSPDHAPEQEELRQQIDALDEEAEAVAERAAGGEKGEAPGAPEREEDVVPSHPAPEPPD